MSPYIETIKVMLVILSLSYSDSSPRFFYQLAKSHCTLQCVSSNWPYIGNVFKTDPFTNNVTPLWAVILIHDFTKGTTSTVLQVEQEKAGC